METVCSVVNCGNTTSSKTKVFFKFPLASESFDICIRWVQNSENQKLLQDFSLGGHEQLKEHYVCSDHFLDKDFAVFGQPHSGLKCQAVPLMIKKKPKIKCTAKRKKKRKVNKSSTIDAAPVSQCLIEESSKTEDFLPAAVKLEDSLNKSCLVDPVPHIMSIKEEPDIPDEIENTLPCPLVNPEDKYIVNSTYDAVFVAPFKEEPEIIERILPLPCTTLNLDENEPESAEIDIEEVNFPDTNNDETVEMETDEDQFQDLSESSDDEFDEEFDGDPSILLNINDVQYLNGKMDKSLDQRRKDASRQARLRQRETQEKRAIRLEKTRIRAQERRKKESEVQTTIRRYKSAVRAAVKRSSETEEEKRKRQEKNKIRAAERRKNMTPEQRAEWRERNRIQTRERRQKESEIKKIVRRYNNAIRASVKRSCETPEQRMERRLKDALRAAERRKSETPEERQERLRKDRERITLRRLQMLMSETPEQREARLKKERERMYRKRHGIKGDTSTETSNDGTDSQHGSEDFNLSAILSMYPPNIEIRTPDDADS